MRLIDVDELQERIEKAYEGGLVQDMEDISFYINTEQTAEAIPIEWIEKVKTEAVKKAEESQHKGVRYWDDVREQYNFACSLWQLLAMWRKENERTTTDN